MLRTKLKDSLKEAMKSKDKRRLSTLRLISATLHDRDIAAREGGSDEGISDTELLQMLTTMVRQRKDSIVAYTDGGREDLAQAEQEEIEIISDFLPKQFDDAEMEEAIQKTIDEIGAEGLKDMGKTMGALKENYTGRMDFAKASGLVKAALNA